MQMGIVACSPTTRAKLWASNGLEIFLRLLSERVSAEGEGGEGEVMAFDLQSF